MTSLVETDARSRLTLPGHPNQRFLVRENADGSFLLEPAVVMTAAQHQYDTDPELRALLTEAAKSPTARQKRKRLPVT